MAVDVASVRERLTAAGDADLAAWEQLRAHLQDAVGEVTFEIWLAGLELIAIDLESTLVVSTPPETASWVTQRFGRVLDVAAQRAGRRLRVADAAECRAAGSLAPGAAETVAGATPAASSPCTRAGGNAEHAVCAADVQTTGSASALSDVSAACRADGSLRGPTTGQQTCLLTPVSTTKPRS